MGILINERRREYWEKTVVKVFFVNKLKKRVRPEEYEKWVRERDYPESKKISTIKSYQVYKVKESLLGERPFDYIEVIDVTDVEKYKNDLNSPTVKALLEEWKKYVGESAGVYTEVI